MEQGAEQSDRRPRPIDPGVDIGHVHLKVADLDRALEFYVGILGFELQQRFGSEAAFVSAGGYHHHVAYNIWKGRGIPPQPEGAAGLAYFVVRVPDGAELERVLTRVRAAGLSTAETPQTANPGTGPGVFVRDPAGLGVVLAAAVPAP